MANANATIAGASPTTSGKKSRVWFQKGCYQPLVQMGCIGLKGVQDPVQVDYSDCIDERGNVVRSTIVSAAKPPNITLNARGDGRNQAMLATLANLARSGCAPYLWYASMACDSPSDIGKPSRGVVFGKLKLGPGMFSPMNDTLVSADGATAAVIEYQGEFALLGYKHYYTPQLQKMSGISAPATLRSIAICDDAQCANTCVPCSSAGCQHIAGVTDEEWVYNTGGGNTEWIILPDAEVGGQAVIPGISKVTCIEGRIYATGAGLSVGTIDAVTGYPKFTNAVFYGSGGVSVTPVSPLTNPVQMGNGNIGVGGADGTFYVSRDGVSFYRVRVGDASYEDFKQIAVADDGTIYAIAVGSANAIVLMYSTNNGTSWTTMQPSPVTGVTWSDVVKHTVFVSGNEATFVLGGKIFNTSCALAAGATKTYTQKVAGGSNVIGVGACDGDCDVMFSVAYNSANGGIAEIKWTVDGFNDEGASVTVATLPGADANSAPFACCSTSSGMKTVFAIGDTLYSLQTYADILPDEIVGV